MDEVTDAVVGGAADAVMDEMITGVVDEQVDIDGATSTVQTNNTNTSTE